jgi:hypothetical protein
MRPSMAPMYLLCSPYISVKCSWETRTVTLYLHVLRGDTTSS